MGVSPVKKKDGEVAAPSPIDWPDLIAHVRTKHGFSFCEVLDLTPAQLFAILGPSKDKIIGRHEIDRRAAEKRREMFDRVCKARKITRLQLGRMELNELLKHVRAVCGSQKIDEGSLLGWAREYAARKD